MALPPYDQNTPAPTPDVEPESVPDAPAPLEPMVAADAPASGDVVAPEPPLDGAGELPDMAEGVTTPREGVGMLAGIGDFLGKLVNRGKAVKAPPSYGAAVAAEKAARVQKFAGRLLEETITVGDKTIKLDFSPLGADERHVDVLINAVAQEYRTVLAEAKRGRISDKKLQALATETNMTEAKIMELVQGDILNAERVLGANRVLGAVAKRVLATRDEIKLAGALDDPEAQHFMAQQLAALLDVESRVRGVSSELGRALRALQVPVEGLPEGKRIASLMRQVFDPTGKGFKRFMTQLDDIESPEQMTRFAQLLQAAPDAYTELWLNMLLSGPATHAANIVGNSMATMNGIVERLAAGGIGAVRRKLGGTDNGVYFDEGIEMLMSTVSAASDAWRASWKLLRKGERTFGPMTNKFDLVTGRAISAEAFGASGPLGWGVDALGGMVNLPMTFLATEDEFFKVFNFQLGLKARALRQAKQQGLRGEAMRQEMARIMSDPTTFRSAFEEAEEYAKYVTFNRDLGAVGQSLVKFSNAAPPITKMILPFVTAPANLAHYNFERLPIVNLLGRQLRNDLRGKNGAVARDLAMAKVGVGATASAVTAGFVFNGWITGRGPLDPNVRRSLEEQGWQPYSIWDPVTGRYVSYERTDPLGMFLGTVADSVQIMAQLPTQDAQTLAAAITVAFSGVLMNKTYVKGFAAVVNALEAGARGDVEGGGVQKAWQQYLASHVPAIAAQAAREYDPVMRDVRSLADAFIARIPGYSKNLPAVRDLYGRPRLREGLTGWAPDLVLPFKAKTPQHEPGLYMIVENGISIHPMSRTVVGPNPGEIEVDPVRAAKLEGVALTPQEYDRWGEILLTFKVGGKTLKEKLDSMAEDKALRASHGEGPDSRLAIKVKGEVLKYRKRALLKLMKENDGAVWNRVKDYYRNKRDRARLSFPVEAEEGSSVDAGGVDISAGVQRIAP